MIDLYCTLHCTGRPIDDHFLLETLAWNTCLKHLLEKQLASNTCFKHLLTEDHSHSGSRWRRSLAWPWRLRRRRRRRRVYRKHQQLNNLHWSILSAISSWHIHKRRSVYCVPASNMISCLDNLAWSSQYSRSQRSVSHAQRSVLSSKAQLFLSLFGRANSSAAQCMSSCFVTGKWHLRQCHSLRTVFIFYLRRSNHEVRRVT